MVHDVELELGVVIEIGFEGDRLFLFSPMAEQPSEWHLARYEANGQLSIFKPSRGKMQTCLQQRRGAPSRFKDGTLTSTCCLHSGERKNSAAAIVMGEEDIPESQQEPGGESAEEAVDQDQSPHKILLLGWYDCGHWLGKGRDACSGDLFSGARLECGNRPSDTMTGCKCDDSAVPHGGLRDPMAY